MAKYRVQLVIDVYTERNFAEVEAESEQQAKMFAEEQLREWISETVKLPAQDFGYEVDWEAVPEPTEDSPQWQKDEWERYGDEIDDMENR